VSPTTEDAYGIGYFTVDVTDATVGTFTSVRGLEAQIDYLEYREGGVNGVVHRLPGPARYPNLVLSQGLTVKGPLEAWLGTVGLRPQRKVVVVTLCDADGGKIRSWSFADAYPVRWTGPVLSLDGVMIAGEELEIAHAGLLS
jgi:phage tail-like protein